MSGDEANLGPTTYGGESQREAKVSMGSEIRVGDEVQLLSGGPIMTVGRIWAERGQTLARCDWVENGKQKGVSVAVTSLKLANE